LHAAVRQRVPAVSRYIEEFERTAAREAARLGFEGVVCGHIHQVRAARLGGVWYYNTGDWVDSCTALAEGLDGRLHLWHLAGANAQSMVI
jgi:UDP-2,3-diacylglucosamine pyrophosphatase LpxH